MPVGKTNSYYAQIQGQRMDKKLLETFEEAVKGQGDGRVSMGDVGDLIKSKVADAGKLTDIERATLLYALDKFRVTDAGRKELASVVENLGADPAFVWQRSSTGPVDIRADQAAGVMPLAQRMKKAGDFIRKNSELVGGSDQDKLFHHPEHSNMGTFAYLVDGDMADRMVALGRAGFGHRVDTSMYDPAVHDVVVQWITEDENDLSISLIDKKSGEVTHFGEVGLVDLGYVTDEESARNLTEAFGTPDKYDDALKDLVQDGKIYEAWEQLDDFYPLEEALIEEIQDLPNDIDIGNLDRDDHPLKAGRDALWQTVKPFDDKWNTATYRTTNRDIDIGTTPYTGDMPALAKSMLQSAMEWTDRDLDYKTDEGYKPTVEVAGKAFDAAQMEAAAQSIFNVHPEPSTTSVAELTADIKAMVAGLGDLSKVKYVRASSPANIELDDPDTQGGKMTIALPAVAHGFVNEETGHYLQLYARDPVPDDLSTASVVSRSAP